MNLKEFLAIVPRGRISCFANKTGISVVYMSQLTHGQDGRVPSPELCVVIERESNYLVTRQELRPKDFFLIWPDLAHLALAQAETKPNAAET